MLNFDEMAALTRLDRRLTARDLDGLPHEWDTRYELIRGVLFMSRKPSIDHQMVLTRLLLSVGPSVLSQGALIVQEPGVVWEEDGEDNVAPDMAIVFGPLPSRRSKLRRCPDICVEVVSPGAENRKRDFEAKRELYWRRGAREYWIVDPEGGCVLRLTRGKRAWKQTRLGRRARITTRLIPKWKGISVRDLLG